MSSEDVIILDQIEDEADRQFDLWGEQNHPLRHPGHVSSFSDAATKWKRINQERVEHPDLVLTWDGILLEEVFEALEATSEAQVREELVQVAAVCLSMVKSLDRKYAQELDAADLTDEQ